MKAIVLDIEGTTTPIDFVHKILFPYSYERLSSYILSNSESAQVKQCLELTRVSLPEAEQAQAQTKQLIETLLQWLAEDRKHPALKLVQGLIWEEGYVKKEIFGQVYPDVLPAFNIWKSRDIKFGIYSSGSVLAQKLLFKHSTEGDLSSYLSFHFDTAVGAKKEKASYEHIASQLKLNPSDILFASDIGDELAAAKQAGFNVIQIIRPGTAIDPRFEIRPYLLEI
jgi:enolase-phosphatase E1